MKSETPRTDAAMAVVDRRGVVEAVRRGVKGVPSGWKLAKQLEEQLAEANAAIARIVPLAPGVEPQKEIRNPARATKINLDASTSAVAADLRTLIHATEAGRLYVAVIAARSAAGTLRAAKRYADRGYRGAISRCLQSKLRGTKVLKRGYL